MKNFPNKLFENCDRNFTLLMRETGNILRAITAEIQKFFRMNIFMGDVKFPRF